MKQEKFKEIFNYYRQWRYFFCFNDKKIHKYRREIIKVKENLIKIKEEILNEIPSDVYIKIIKSNDYQINFIWVRYDRKYKKRINY